MSKYSIIISFVGFCGCVVVLLMSVSCMDADILGQNRYHIQNGYFLKYFDEGDAFYVIKRRDDTPNGVFEGVITRIGWNESFCRHVNYK